MSESYTVEPSLLEEMEDQIKILLTEQKWLTTQSRARSIAYTLLQFPTIILTATSSLFRSWWVSPMCAISQIFLTMLDPRSLRTKIAERQSLIQFLKHQTLINFKLKRGIYQPIDQEPIHIQTDDEFETYMVWLENELIRREKLI